MNAINLMNRRLDVICNQFRKEKIGENELNLMLPKDEVPIINHFYYEKMDDAFEIYFTNCNDLVCRRKNDIDFLEDKYGHLVAIRIRNFSKLNVDSIRLNILTSIENEVEHLSIELTKKQNILNNVIAKRKLMFLGNLVKHDYKELRKGIVK